MRAERREIVLSRGVYWAAGFVALGVALYWLRDVLTPIFLAFTIAYILDPVVDRLETWRIPRPAAIALVLFGFLGAIAGFLLLVVPDVVRNVATVLRELPSHAERALTRAEPWLAQQGIKVPHTADEWIARLKGQTDNLSSNLLAPAGEILKTLIGKTASAIGAALGALIVPILAIYLLNDFDRLIAQTRDLVPPRWRPSVVSYAREIDKVLSQFMRGQITVMAILAVLYGGSYALLGVRLAIPIGIAAGVLNFVPYVGGAFALVAGLLMTLIGGGGVGQMIGVVVAYVVVQTLEGFVITPRIVGESVGLSELWVLVALFVGGEVFGFLGVLLAVPAAAVLKIFVARGVEHYRQSSLFVTADEVSEGVMALGGAGPPLGAELDDEVVPELATESEPEPVVEAEPEPVVEPEPERVVEPEAEPSPSEPKPSTDKPKETE